MKLKHGRHLKKEKDAWETAAKLKREKWEK
jgi:hypothetical protein